MAIICPQYAEGSDAFALVEQSLAQGYACELICLHGEEPAPAHAEAGRVRVHRISLRRGAGEVGYAVQAARRVHELRLGGRCDRVVCVDAGWCETVMRCIGLGNALDIHERGRVEGRETCLDRWRWLETALGERGAEVSV